MKILISYLTKRNNGAVDSVTYAFFQELKKEFNIKAVYRNRYFGVSKNKYIKLIQSIFYTVFQYLNWLYNIIVFRPDIVHYPVTSFSNFKKSMFFLLSAKKLGVNKVIGHLHGGAFKVFFEKLNTSQKEQAIKKINRLDYFIVLSSSWANFAKTKGFNVEIRIVHNPINKEFHEYFNNKNYIKSFNNNNELNLLYVGRLEQQKGFVDLIHALSSLDSVKLEIMGDYVSTEEKNEIEETIENLDINSKLHFNGYLTGNEKTLKFSQSNVLILPSYFENFPLVVLEAACASCAIIASRIGAIPDYFTDMKDIIFVEPGNIPTIKQSIEKLVNSPELVKSLGQNARILYENTLNRDIAISNLREVYSSIRNNNS